MHKVLSWSRRGLLAAGVLASLGFGAAQAFASPSTTTVARGCTFSSCDYKCRAAGASAGGSCNQYGECECSFLW